MSYSNVITCAGGDQFVPPIVTQGAACHFERFSSGGTACCDIEMFDEEFHPDSVAKLHAVFHVAVTFLSAKMKVAMCGYAMCTSLLQCEKQSYGISTSAQSHKDAAGLSEVLSNKLLNCCCHYRCSECFYFVGFSICFPFIVTFSSFTPG